MPIAARSRRADAARNRVLLLDVARARLATDGLEFTVAQIAQAAGVGKGTAYRHFPTKDALIDAVLEERMAESFARLHQLLDIADPAAAFEAFARFSVELFVRDRALLESVCHARSESDDFAACRCEAEDIADSIIARARDAGALRPDVRTEEVRQLLLAVALTVPVGGSHDAAAWERPLAIVLDGMRAGATQPHAAGG